jgi:hypothetical protein
MGDGEEGTKNYMCTQPADGSSPHEANSGEHDDDEHGVRRNITTVHPKSADAPTGWAEDGRHMQFGSKFK